MFGIDPTTIDPPWNNYLPSPPPPDGICIINIYRTGDFYFFINHFVYREYETLRYARDRPGGHPDCPPWTALDSVNGVPYCRVTDTRYNDGAEMLSGASTVTYRAADRYHFYGTVHNAFIGWFKNLPDDQYHGDQEAVQLGGIYTVQIFVQDIYDPYLLSFYSPTQYSVYFCNAIFGTYQKIDFTKCKPVFPLQPPNPPPPNPPNDDEDCMNCCCNSFDDSLIRELFKRVETIQLALNSEKYAYQDNTQNPRVANLGYYIERIARVLGISVNDDGTIKSIRQKRIIERGQDIPGGWNFGQWGLNTGSNSNGQLGGSANEYRDGIVYEQRSNIKKENSNGVEITQGNYVLCENIPQLLDEVFDDLDKALGWQDLGAGAIPNADGSGKYCTFEGLAQLFIEVAYDLSRISQHTSQTQIASLICQAVMYEVLKSTGQPITPKTFQVDIGGNNLADIPYPGISDDAPSNLEQTGWILQNLAPILGAMIKLKNDTTQNNTQPNP